MDDEEKSWCVLVELQTRLRKSKDSNSLYEKEIQHLKKTKEETQQRLADLHLSSSQETISKLLADHDIVSMTKTQEDLSIRNKTLMEDLNSVTSLVGKLKLHITRCDQSIQILENDSNEVKASIATACDERKKAAKDIESIRTMIERQKSTITQLTDDIAQEQMIGDQLKKRVLTLKSKQKELLHRQHVQQQHLFKLKEAVKDTRCKARETKFVMKARLRQLRARSTEVNQLNVRLSRLNRTLNYRGNPTRKTIAPSK